MKLSNEGLFRRSIQNALAMGAACSAMTFVSSVAAQEKPKDEKATELETVEVTGSRLPQPNLTSSSSYTIITDQELQFQGTINIEGMLNKMPQVFAEYSTGDSNGASGTATVSLRGLGSNRTLVLIDGKRLMPGDPGLTSSDLNFIPAALVDTVEILSGGASAVYGSDAIAGVVNFKMKRDFDGFRLDTEGTRTTDGDGTTRNLTAAWGTNFGRGAGNVTMYGSLVTSQAITEDNRDVSTCSLQTPAGGTTHLCRGSRVIAEGRIYSYDLGAYYIVNPNGTRTFIPEDPNITFNFGPYNYFQRPQERYLLGGFGHREVNEHFDIYGDLMYMQDRTNAQIAPSGMFGAPATISCTSPLMSVSQQNTLCPGGGAGNNVPGFASLAILKRTIEVGPRSDDRRHTDTRLVVGTRGAIAGPWKYDLSFLRGESVLTESYLNDVSISKAQDALASCPSGNAQCVPLDIFAFGAITPAMANYIRGTGLQSATVYESVSSLVITTDLGAYGVRIPSSNSGIQFAVGAEHRREQLDYNPDYEFQTGDLAGQGGTTFPLSGGYSVDEEFTEIQLPLVEDAPGIHLLSIDGAYRHSEYSSTKSSNTYKMAMQYQPTADLTARAGFQRASRAPAVQEYFLPQSFGLFGFSDPCAGANLFNNPGAPTQAQCANTGVTAAQYNAGVNGTAGSIQDCNAGQCNALFVGNVALQPEESDTKSFGLVFTPGFVKDLSVTLDYFDISIDNAINAAPGSTLVTCLQTGDPAACSQIHRGTGRLSGSTAAGTHYIDAMLLNTTNLSTTGLDVETNYKMGMGGIGSLAFSYTATYLMSFETQAGPGTAVADCAGLYGVYCGTPSPKYRHKFRTTWAAPMGLTLSGMWRYYDAVQLDATTGDAAFFAPVTKNDVIDKDLKAKNYLDLSGSYALPVTGESIKLRFGVNNVFDVSPQGVSGNAPNTISSPPFGNGNTFPNVYDISRVWFVGLTADF